MLRTLSLQSVYKSDQDSILEDFYLPTLSVAKSYDRAVGFFSASTISYAAQALSVFVRNDGCIRLILGAFADPRDIEAINQGLKLRELSDLIGEQFISQMGEATDELFEKRFEALSWLVAMRRLEIRIALRAQGMYHDKVGIITDAAGDSVVFTGSANESAQALLPSRNYESIDVFPSWKPELQGYFEPHRRSFERLWKNQSKNTAVIDLPTAISEKLLSVAKSMEAPPDPVEEVSIAARLFGQPVEFDGTRNHMPRVPETLYGMPFEIREHQRDALNQWRLKGAFHGIFDLATGAGKTITAIYGAVQMSKKIPGLTLVIAAPYQNLADQWCEILEQFNIRPLQCYVSKTMWEDDLQKLVHDIEMGASEFAAIVVVNRTLKSPEFQNAIKRVPAKQFLWIGDECHHHSSASYEGFLPENADYRIGLSATPEHYIDQERNVRLKAYYGDVVFTYTLKQAIDDKVLTPYNYYPEIVYLTAEEGADFVQLSEQIAILSIRGGKGPGGSMSPALTSLVMRRARLVASAENKLPALRRVLANKMPEPHTLFYCGDGRVDAFDDGNDLEPDDQSTERQIEVISQELDAAGWRNSRFTSKESRRERESIMRNFKIGLVDGLVAIKCLDEGIDVPACKTAYILASSRDPRQFIQRRGRILRRSPGKTFANIFDFIVILPADMSDEDSHARKLVRSELMRVAEFSALAINKSTAYEVLRPILLNYDLEHML